jgi:hypothetical protein
LRPGALARGRSEIETMTQNHLKAKIGIACIALLALAATPLANAGGIGNLPDGQTDVFVDLNGDGDCYDAGEHTVVPTPGAWGRVYVSCGPF